MNNVELLQLLDPMLQTDNFFMDIVRGIGWTIVLWLKELVDIFDDVIQSCYKLVGFINSDFINNKVTGLKELLFAVMAISICYLGYKIIFKKETKGNALTGLLLTIVVTMSLPILISKGLEVFSSSVIKVPEELSVTDEVLKSNIHDLYVYGKYDNFILPSNTSPNLLNSETFKYLNTEETIKAGDVGNQQGNIFTRQLDVNDVGEAVDKKFDGSLFLQRDGYYRYHIEWFSILSSLLVVGFTLFLMSIKVVKIAFNLAIDRIVGTILIFTDLEEGKRAKELVKHILTTIAVLMVSVVSMELYTGFIAWTNTVIPNQNFVVNIIILLGASVALLEGPTIMQKLLGVQTDSGLGKTVVGMFTASKIAGTPGKIAKGAVNATKLGINGAKMVGNGVGKLTNASKATYDNTGFQKDKSNNSINSYSDLAQKSSTGEGAEFGNLTYAKDFNQGNTEGRENGSTSNNRNKDKNETMGSSIPSRKSNDLGAGSNGSSNKEIEGQQSTYPDLESEMMMNNQFNDGNQGSIDDFHNDLNSYDKGRRENLGSNINPSRNRERRNGYEVGATNKEIPRNVTRKNGSNGLIKKDITNKGGFKK